MDCKSCIIYRMTKGIFKSPKIVKRVTASYLLIYLLSYLKFKLMYTSQTFFLSFKGNYFHSNTRIISRKPE